MEFSQNILKLFKKCEQDYKNAHSPVTKNYYYSDCYYEEYY